MTTKSAFIRHLIGGGWAADFGGRAQVAINGTTATFPFLTQADNLVYKLDGGVDKPGGTSKLNTTTFESGADIKGIFDYWITGTAGSSAQHRIVHVGTVVKKDDGDGSFTNLKTGLEAGKMPDYTVSEDLLIFTSNSTVDVPQSWDGTTQQDLAGSPPNFSFSVVWKGRVWAAGDAANPSKLYYTGRFDPTNWTAGSSGEFNIDPSDGDKITGLAVYKNRLWVFKGPVKGSIHTISGSAPTGDDPFRRDPFITGVGAVNHQSIFSFIDDVGFVWSDGDVYSLSNISAEGLFAAATLTFPIHSWLHSNIKANALDQAWATTLADDGIVLIGLTLSGATKNNIIIGFDFRFTPIRWFKWPSFKNMATALAVMLDPDDNNKRTIVLGGNDGFVRKTFRTTKTLDTGGTINQSFTTPYTDYGIPETIKTIAAGSVGAKTTGDSSVVFKWQRDNQAAQSKEISISTGGAQLATSMNGTDFILGTHTLGGDTFTDEFFDLEEGGEFRSIRYTLSNNRENESIGLDDFGALIEPGGFATE